MSTLSPEIQKLLQEVIILATGTGATREQMTALESFQGNGDWVPLISLINGYMGSLSAASSTAAVVKTVALNGLGMSLTQADAASVAAILDAGQMSWAEVFVVCLNMTDNNGQTLNNRAEAAHDFIAGLATAQKSELFTGAAVSFAVKNLLQGINANTISLGNGQSGLKALIANLSADGIKGAVVDGYVSGATVFADANGDGRLNPGEWSATTDATGNYTLPGNTAGGTIIASGGTDIMTGQAFLGVLTAPTGSTVINPITTLVESLVAQGRTVADATAVVQTALNLPANINPLSFDPIAVLGSSTASAADKAVALGVQASASQVANIITQVSAALDAGGGPPPQALSKAC